ncbi:MAG TPA: hypothetical protein PLT91_05545 [Clostridia bacterium]|jgi:hypothetical protein|nr:MAG: hypothetical protein BWX97_00587 [Firmicutes bacterium ADurb.Bin146]HOD93416.1 hypothetical protein [Clostridia bacterium]HQM39685.1 hypothetical protein [Clostridia bacterium]
MNKILFSEDTLITIADSTRKQIADIHIGDRIISADGSVYIVTKLAMAATNRICIITTESGKKLKFAESSTIQSNNISVYSEMNLNIKEILTNSGTEKITNIIEDEYDGRVFAMYLNKDAYVIANDFVVK